MLEQENVSSVADELLTTENYLSYVKLPIQKELAWRQMNTNSFHFNTVSIQNSLLGLTIQACIAQVFKGLKRSYHKWQSCCGNLSVKFIPAHHSFS